MATATARMTVGSVFGMVGTAANTVTGSLNAISSGIGMANAYVENAAAQQQLRILKDQSTFRNRLAEEHAQETAVRQVEVVKFCKQSAQHAEFYKTAYDDIMKVFEEARPTTNPSSVKE